MTRVVVCCDGLDPAYLDAVETPGWDAIAAEGQAGTCDAAVPSLTNVNNAGIVTGAYPDAHGITGNTYYDRERRERVRMEDSSFLTCRTRLAAAADRGAACGALVAKEKLLGLVGEGCEVAVTAEDPPRWLERAVGPAPDIYSGDASAWLLSAAAHVLDRRDLVWCFVSTTAVVPHRSAPADRMAHEWVGAIDRGLASLHDRSAAIVATADHGMAPKRNCVDLDAVLARAGRDATVVRLIRDAHTYHHRNLGGAAYVYLRGAADDAASLLLAVDGVERALTATEAAAHFRLPPDRIGDLVVLGDEATVFGPVGAGVRGEVALRSHGSHHERTVPYATTADVGLSVNLEAFDVLAPE